MLSELLEKLNCSRNAFFKHHKVELLNLSVSEIRTELSNSMSIGRIPESFVESTKSSPETAGCSKDVVSNDDKVELVSMGHYSLRKLMNFKLCRVEVK